jgi:hypothetical protein
LFVDWRERPWVPREYSGDVQALEPSIGAYGFGKVNRYLWFFCGISLIPGPEFQLSSGEHSSCEYSIFSIAEFQGAPK